MSSDTAQEFAFHLPDAGEGLTEAEIIEWYYNEGDGVEEDEPLVDIETDKAVVEIPSPCTGTLKSIEAESGDIVQVGEVIAVFLTTNPPRQQTNQGPAGETNSPSDSSPRAEEGSEDERIEGIRPSSTQIGKKVKEGQVSDSTAAQSANANSDMIFAAPSTRSYARKRNVDLNNIAGSGPGGRILRADIDEHLERSASSRASMSIPEGGNSTNEAGDDEIIVEQLRGLRRTIAQNMQQSSREIPHVTSGFEADATSLVDLKERLNDKHDVDITYTAILIKAVVPGLKAFPLVNASIDMEAGEITKYGYYNIGVATHTDDGLIVPVIDHVDEKSLAEVAMELNETVAAARERDIAPEKLRGGTFTITNTGSHGGHGTFGTPIIRHPEAAILGVGQIDEQIVPVDGKPAVQDRIGFSFSYDHRLVDGVTAGQFMEHVIEGIEDPDLLFTRL